MADQTLDQSTIRVLIVDDHAMVRDGLRARIARESDIVVAGEAEDREGGLTLVDELRPDVVVLDIRLRQDSGIEVAKRIRLDYPETKILILSAYDYEQYVRALARIGVDGYISKENSQDELVQAIRDVVGGGSVLTPNVASKVMRAMSDQQTGALVGGDIEMDELTLREIEVLELMREGMRNQGIADHLIISSRTVESHVAKIMSKLDATSRTEAIRIATDAGILS